MTGIDIFAGAGGFSLGMEKAGIKVLVAVEKDKWAVETYRANFKGVKVIERNIQDVSAKELLQIAGLKKRELGILFGGPPCQGFSTTSKARSINNPKSKLMWEFVRMTRGAKPKIFYIENVPGLFAYKDFFMLLMETLEKCSYVVRCLMMDAASYGIPQYRKRIFIQGVRKDLGILPVFPPPTHFDLKQDKEFIKQNKFPPSSLAQACFATNGFVKEEVKDLYWNSILHIQMNRKTAGDVLGRATSQVIAEGMLGLIKKHGENMKGETDECKNV